MSAFLCTAYKPCSDASSPRAISIPISQSTLRALRRACRIIRFSRTTLSNHEVIAPSHLQCTGAPCDFLSRVLLPYSVRETMGGLPSAMWEEGSSSCLWAFSLTMLSFFLLSPWRVFAGLVQLRQKEEKKKKDRPQK